MSRYRSIQCLIWTDDKFPFLGDDGKLVMFHLMTTPYSTPFGLFKASIGTLADEMRWPSKRYEKGFAELYENGMAKYNKKHHVVLLVNHLKYNHPANPNVVTSWGKIFGEVPNCDLKEECYQMLKSLTQRLGKGLPKAFEKAFPNSMRIQEQYQEQYQEQDKEKTTPPPPVLECPHQEIIALYHEILPELPQVKVWGGDREAHLRARWREDPERQCLEWWRRFFEVVGECGFLMGDNDRGWKATLPWLLNREKFNRVIEGAYLGKRGEGQNLPEHTRKNLEALQGFREREGKEHGQKSTEN